MSTSDQAPENAATDYDWRPAYRWRWRCLFRRHEWREKHDGRCIELCCIHCGRWKPW